MKHAWKPIFIIVFTTAHFCESQIEIETKPIRLIGKNTYSILRKSQKILGHIIRLTKSLKDLNRILNGCQTSNTSLKQPCVHRAANPVGVSSKRTRRPYTTWAKQAMEMFKTKNCSIDYNFAEKKRNFGPDGVLQIPRTIGFVLHGCDNKHYLIGTTRRTIERLSAFCSGIGMWLASFQSLEEMICLQSLLKNYTGLIIKDTAYFVNYVDYNMNSSFGTCNPYGKLDDTMWANGQPDNNGGNEGCASLVLSEGPQFGIRDVSCFLTLQYICKYDPKYMP